MSAPLDMASVQQLCSLYHLVLTSTTFSVQGEKTCLQVSSATCGDSYCPVAYAIKSIICFFFLLMKGPISTPKLDLVFQYHFTTIIRFTLFLVTCICLPKNLIYLMTKALTNTCWQYIFNNLFQNQQFLACNPLARYFFSS